MYILVYDMTIFCFVIVSLIRSKVFLIIFSVSPKDAILMSLMSSPAYNCLMIYFPSLIYEDGFIFNTYVMVVVCGPLLPFTYTLAMAILYNKFLDLFKK